MKIIITADWHIDNNQNLTYNLKTAKWIKKVCQEQNINLIFIAGDFANTRQFANILAQNQMVNILDIWRDANIHAHLLIGNHEQYYKHTDITKDNVTALRPFKKLAHIYENPTIVDIDSHQFFFLPFCENRNQFRSIIKEWRIKLKKGVRNVLIAHQDIFGAVMNNLSNYQDKSGIKYEEFKDFDYSFFGHYHSRQKLGPNSLMVGSPFMLNFGEDFNKKGVTIYDTETNDIEFIPNPKAQLYITLTPDMKYEDKVKSRFVRFLLHEPMVPEAQQELKDKVLKLGALSVNILPVYNHIGPKTDLKSNSSDLENLIKEYVMKNKKDLDEEKIMKLYEQIVSKGV